MTLVQTPYRRLRSSAAALYVLPTLTLLFLFSGFYKTTVPSPVDWTVLMGSFVALALSLRVVRLQGIVQPLVGLIVLLNVFLALRLIPDFAPWGIRKIAEVFSFGSVALMAGYAIFVEPSERLALKKLLVCVGIAASAVVVLQSLKDPTSFSAIGGASYQLTGLLLAFSMVASASLKNPFGLAASITGALVCGNVTAAIFGSAAVAVMWFLQHDAKAAGVQMLASLSLIGLYSAVVGPPLSLNRIVIKGYGVALRYEQKTNRSSASAVSLDRSQTSSQATESGKDDAAPRPVDAGLLEKSSAGGETAEGTNDAGYEHAAVVQDVDLADGEREQAREATVDMPVMLDGLFKDKKQFEERAKDSANRLDIWKAAISHIHLRPILGWGYGNLNYSISPMAHNVLLELFAEAGLIAVILAIVILTYAGVIGLRGSDPFALCCFLIVGCDLLMSAYWGGRVSMFALGLIAGAWHDKRASRVG